jgi:hypothetical protein
MPAVYCKKCCVVECAGGGRVRVIVEQRAFAEKSLSQKTAIRFSIPKAEWTISSILPL